ncbi:MAG: hypothetical protein U0T84_08485 [Chitinophagales bacterium]
MNLQGGNRPFHVERTQATENQLFIAGAEMKRVKLPYTWQQVDSWNRTRNSYVIFSNAGMI